jgi:hypothetical protein
MERALLIVVAMMALFGIGPLLAQSSGSILIEKPFSRETPSGSNLGVGYFTIINKGAEADRLVSASTPKAGKVEIHETVMQNGVMKMRELAGGLVIDAGKTVILAPEGNHLMLIDLKAPLKQGDKVPLTLNLEKAGKIEVTLDVEAIGAKQPSDMQKSMPMHKM